MVDLSNETLNIIGIVLSASLPVILVYYFKIIEHRREKKELKIAADLKIANEKTANDLKLASVDIAKALQTHLDSKIEDINSSIEDLGKRIDLVNVSQTEISKRVDAIHVKQVEVNQSQLELITDLQERADLVNGNIKNIRNDIMDVQESLENIADNMYELPPLNQRKRERREKRKRISDDADAQNSVKHRIGTNR